MKLLDQEQHADITDLFLELLYGDETPEGLPEEFCVEAHITIGHPAYHDDLTEPREKIPDGYTFVGLDFDVGIPDDYRNIYLGHHIVADDYLSSPAEELGERIRQYIYSDDSFLGAELTIDQLASEQQIDHERIGLICDRIGTLLAESVDWTEVAQYE